MPTLPLPAPAPRWAPALLLVLAATASAAAPAPGAGPRLDATSVTLANGMRVVLAPDSLASTVDATLWFRSGTRHESAAQAGLAVLAARLAFRGGSRDPLAPLVAEGGTGALTVTPDVTSFSTTVPEEGLGTALTFLAERLRAGPASAADLASERSAIRAENARSERTAVARGLARLWRAAWPGHAYAQTGAPPAAGSDALAAAVVDAWRRARFTPANAVLTLAGAFEPERTLAEVRSRLESLPRGQAPVSPTRPVAPRAATRASERIDAPARLCLVGWRGPGAADPDAPALELLATCLGTGSQARLARSLVQDWGLAVATQAGFVAQQDGSLLWTLAVVPPGADSAAVERTLLDAAKGITQHPPEAFELERARRQLESAVWFGLQTARQRGQALGEAVMLAGGAEAASRRLAALDKVTSEDLSRAASRVMSEGARATVWMLPAAERGGR